MGTPLGRAIGRSLEFGATESTCGVEQSRWRRGGVKLLFVEIREGPRIYFKNVVTVALASPHLPIEVLLETRENVPYSLPAAGKRDCICPRTDNHEQCDGYWRIVITNRWW